jgi:hypothetical protein
MGIWLISSLGFSVLMRISEFFWAIFFRVLTGHREKRVERGKIIFRIIF